MCDYKGMQSWEVFPYKLPQNLKMVRASKYTCPTTVGSLPVQIIDPLNIALVGTCNDCLSLYQWFLLSVTS